MKTLFLLRHAKSDWRKPGLADHDRPLNDRGRRAARRLGELFLDRGWQPARIVCSSALRARQTLELLAAETTFQTRPEFDRAIYEADEQRLLNLIRGTDADLSSLILIGHNPTFEDLARGLCDAAKSPEACDRMAAKYPTAGLAIIELAGGWHDIRRQNNRLAEFVVPKDL